MNKKKIQRILATSVSIMILGTTITMNGMTNLKVYAADNSTNSYEKKVGAGEITGTLKSKEDINYDYYHEGKNEEYLVITVTDYSGANDSSYFIKKSTDESKKLEKVNIGQYIKVNYVLGTPIKVENEWAFPLTSITLMPICGVADISGKVKSKENINYDYDGDGKNEEYFVITVTNNCNGEDRSFFINKSMDESEKVESAIIGQLITVIYVLGTPIKYKSESAFPLCQIIQKVKQTTYTDAQGIRYNLDENSKTAVVNKQKEITGDIVIPKEIDVNGEKYSVTSISVNAFGGCNSLTSITIPESVTSIGGYAFFACTNLTSINIPINLTNIEERTFSGCSKLKSIEISDKVTNIGYHAFYGCSDLKSMTIPNRSTFIGNNVVDRVNYVNTFIRDENSNDFVSKDGVLFNREKSSTATPTQLEAEYDNPIVGYGVACGSLISKKYMKYDYDSDGNSKEYLFISLSSDNEYDGFIEKDSDIGRKLDKAIIGQHIEMGCTTGRPIENAFPITSIKLAPASNTVATNTVATNTVATNTVATNTVATNTVATNTVATNTVATNTVATNTIATNTVAKDTPTATSTTDTTIIATGTHTNSTTTVQEEKQQKQSDNNSETAKSGDVSVLPIASTLIAGAGAMLGVRRKRN